MDQAAHVLEFLRDLGLEGIQPLVGTLHPLSDKFDLVPHVFDHDAGLPDVFVHAVEIPACLCAEAFEFPPESGNLLRDLTKTRIQIGDQLLVHPRLLRNRLSARYPTTDGRRCAKPVSSSGMMPRMEVVLAKAPYIA